MWWATRGIDGLLVACIVLAALGAGYEAVAARQDADRYPPPGQLVDIGGRRLHLDCRGAGSPTVVLEAGGGGTSLDWSLVQPTLAQTTRVCAYDRAGAWWSDPGPLPPAPQRIADDLAPLIQTGGVPGPYLLVTHSDSGL